jgi:DNA-binding XRE family transcriptional regulator
MAARQPPPSDAISAKSSVFNRKLFDERCEALGATTTEQKANLAGVDWSTIHRFTEGDIGPRLEVARRMARRLGVEFAELWPEQAS